MLFVSFSFMVISFLICVDYTIVSLFAVSR